MINLRGRVIPVVDLRKIFMVSVSEETKETRIVVVDIHGQPIGCLVDVGYAAPFYAPLPRDLEDEFLIRFGDCQYVLSPRDDQGRSRLRMYREGSEVHGYLAKPRPRVIGDFSRVIEESYHESATFMNAVVVERFFPGRSVRIHNLSLTESTRAGATATRLDDRDQLIQAIEEYAEIPADIVRIAVEGASLSGDIYT